MLAYLLIHYWSSLFEELKNSLNTTSLLISNTSVYCADNCLYSKSNLILATLATAFIYPPLRLNGLFVLRKSSGYLLFRGPNHFIAIKVLKLGYWKKSWLFTNPFMRIKIKMLRFLFTICNQQSYKSYKIITISASKELLVRQ